MLRHKVCRFVCKGKNPTLIEEMDANKDAFCRIGTIK